MMAHIPTDTRPLNGGTQRIYSFSNGLGASVVRHRYSYGGQAGWWELAVLDAEGELTYDTPITSDVIGWLSEGEVQATLDRIAALDAGEIRLAVDERKQLEDWRDAVAYDGCLLGFEDWKASR